MARAEHARSAARSAALSARHLPRAPRKATLASRIRPSAAADLRNEASLPPANPWTALRTLVFAIFLAAAALLLFHLGRADIRGGEEGAHAVMARNAADRAVNPLNPSPEPSGPPGETPFPYPAAMGLLLRMCGRSEFAMRLPSALAVLLCGILLARLGARNSPLAGAAAAGIFLLSPVAVAVGRLATPEALATLSAIAGFACTSRGAEKNEEGTFGLAGLLFGVSLLLRPWCALGPLAGALVSLEWNEMHRRTRSPRPYLLLLGVSVVVGAAQIILVSLFTPTLTHHWLASTMHALPAAASDPGWGLLARPGLLRSLAPILPLVALGALGSAGGAAGIVDPGVVAWWLTALLLRAVGSPEGARGLLPLAAWALMGGHGAGVLTRWCRDAQWRFPGLGRVFALALAGAVALAVLPALEGSFRPFGGLLGVAGPCAFWGLLVLVVAGRAATPQLKIVLSSLALGFALVFTGHAAWNVGRSMDARNHYRNLEPALRPELQRAALDATAFIAPEPEALSFYAFRRGVSWTSLRNGWPRFLQLADGRHARVYVVPDTSDSPGSIQAAALLWLEERHLERTEELGRRGAVPPGGRVFVNGSPRLPLMGPSRPPGVPEKKAIIHPPQPERRYRRL